MLKLEKKFFINTTLFPFIFEDTIIPGIALSPLEEGERAKGQVNYSRRLVGAKQSRVKKVVLLHGLYCRGWMLEILAAQLRKQGYETFSPSYSTVKQALSEGVEELAEKIQAFKGKDTAYYVGHSMGGLMLRYLQHSYPLLFKDSRVVTLGTPHQGSAFAKHIYGLAMKKEFHFLPVSPIKKAWKDGLDGKVPQWNGEVPLLSIAGTRSGLENWIYQVFPKEVPNDSLVSVEETHLPECQSLKVHMHHLEMIINPRIATYIVDWFNPEEGVSSGESVYS